MVRRGQLVAGDGAGWLSAELPMAAGRYGTPGTCGLDVNVEMSPAGISRIRSTSSRSRPASEDVGTGCLVAQAPGTRAMRQAATWMASRLRDSKLPIGRRQSELLLVSGRPTSGIHHAARMSAPARVLLTAPELSGRLRARSSSDKEPPSRRLQTDGRKHDDGDWNATYLLRAN
jgi:hypothetical protein